MERGSTTGAGQRSWSVVRVAVTGHRDLNQMQVADAQLLVKSSLQDLLDWSGPAGIELLTGFADGADQLVTEQALDIGVPIHVVLPKQADLYSEELNEASAALLERLLADPDVPVTTIQAPDLASAQDSDSGPYSRLGVYLAQSAHAIIALWDGSFVRKPGGTFDVLARFLDRSYQPEMRGELEPLIEPASDTATLTGPVAVWINVDRGADEAARPESCYLAASGAPGLWLKSAEAPQILTSMLEDAGRAAKLLQEVGDDSPTPYPLLDELPTGLEPSTAQAMDEIHTTFLAVDSLAMHRQTRSDSSFVLASWIAAAMGFAFLWFAKIDAANLWLYAYLGLFLGGYLLFRFARDRNWLRQHLSLRIMAETLRVRFFATLLGVQDRVGTRRLLSLTGVASFPGMAWAVEADRIGVPPTGVQAPPSAAQMAIVRSDWVDDQARYFHKKIETLEVRHRRLEIMTRVLYVLSFLTVVVLLIAGSQLKKEYLWSDVSAKTFLVFLMGLLPLWLTIWELHQGRMATRELLWQFRNQADLFNQASMELRWVRDPESQLRVFVELAERSLFEAYLWTIHRFHREFEPPSGG
jgi:hypothetical protein